MASPEINEIRERFGMVPEPPHVVKAPFADPSTPSEMYANAAATIHNQAELGEISTDEAYERLHALDAERAEFGDGWQDRYGESPEELR